VRERARNRDALLLAARKLAGQALVHALERDELQELGTPHPPLGRPHPPNAERKLDVVGDAHVAEERVMLEDESDATVARRDSRDVAPVERNPPVIDLDETRDGAEQGALAAAARAEQDEFLVLLDLERDVVDDRMRLIPLGDLVECDGHGRIRKPEGGAAWRLVPARSQGQSQAGNKSVTGAIIGTQVAGRPKILFGGGDL